ncbi:MAG TPA: protein-glutamate O-methyltransferase CheR [Bacteroidales bacterium]|nr:protein-glutamate O-methyltransferase CheR [Bacteroidales bacterium]
MESLDQMEFDTLISVIRETRGIDFSDYAMSSLRRRFIRFMTMNNLGDPAELAWKIRYDNAYADYFVKEITVNVTEMFRDPSFWSLLRDNILPDLINYPVIRIWHAACSTGQEVYSMAILLNELGVLHKARIMATDINSNVLKTAQKGIFRLNHQELNLKNYNSFGGKKELDEYYTVSGSEVVYDPQLISNVEFRIHDLARDRAFSKFDLILCRNVMIYFNFRLQERVLDIFRESLDKGAYLGIGSKESIEWCKSSRYFQTVSQEEKIYRKL